MTPYPLAGIAAAIKYTVFLLLISVALLFVTFTWFLVLYMFRKSYQLAWSLTYKNKVQQKPDTDSHEH